MSAKLHNRVLGAAMAASLVVLAGCGDGGGGAGGTETVKVDGSSTVFPVIEAVAEEFQKANRGTYRVTVGVSGTGGGFKKFCRGETDLSDASRPISESEREDCAANGIEFIELPVALDALTVVVHPDNDWVGCIKPSELKTMWEPAAQDEITNWSQVRDSFPDRELTLYGPGTDSGTYDYFTEAVMHDSGASRGDFTASEDDNVVVQGVANDLNALGYFGLAYYEENRERLKALKVENSDGECIAPSLETAKSGIYNPLARPLFVYARVSSLNESEAVRQFVEFMLDAERAPTLVKEVGYVPLPAQAYELARENVAERRTGTAFADGAQVGVSIEDLLKAEKRQ